MALHDLQILRDIDRQIAAMQTEVKLLHQEFRHSQRITSARLAALEAKSDRPPPAVLFSLREINEKTIIKIILFIMMVSAGRPMAESMLLALRHGL